MSSWHKLMAGFGACFAFVLLISFMPGRKIVIGTDRTFDVVAEGKTETAESDVLQAGTSAAEGETPSREITPRSKKPRLIPASVKEAAAARAKQSVAAETTAGTGSEPGTEPGIEFEVPSEPVDFGAKVLEQSPVIPESKPPPAPSWAPVVTRSDDPKPTPGKAVSVINTSPAKPETAALEEGVVLDSHPGVAPLLARYPDRDLILCLAGCGDGASIVAVRPRVQMVASAAMQPTSGGGTKPDFGDVICLAGCFGTPGKVVYRNVRLSWLKNESGVQIKSALRAIADRLIAAEGMRLESFPRRWVSAAARSHLNGEEAVESRPLALASPLVTRFMLGMPEMAVSSTE